MVKVVINQDFKDRENGTLRKAGTTVELTEERVAEIKAVNAKLVTVLEAKQPEGNAVNEEVEKLSQELAEANAVIDELRKELAEADKALKDAKKAKNTASNE